jgi:hypothetical protein
LRSSIPERRRRGKPWNSGYRQHPSEAGLAWPPPPHIEALVKEADQCAFVSEVTYLLPSSFVREFDLEGLPLPTDHELFKEVSRLQPVPALIRAFERAFGLDVMNGACRSQMVPMPEMPA